jgi:hypothetical protein
LETSQHKVGRTVLQQWTYVAADIRNGDVVVNMAWHDDERPNSVFLTSVRVTSCLLVWFILVSGHGLPAVTPAAEIARGTAAISGLSCKDHLIGPLLKQGGVLKKNGH